MSLDPLYVAVLGREMRDGDTVHIGAGQADVWLAAKLARALWAPRVRVVAGGTFLLDLDLDLDGSGAAIPRTYGRKLIAGRAATFHQSRVFNDLQRQRVVFAGGLQVDGRGNANLIGVYDGDRLRLRGPGSGGLPTLTSHSDRFFLAVRTHTRRVFVPRASRVSVLGDPVARSAAGFPRHALRAVITPLARFEPTDDGLRLAEVAPSSSIDEVAQNTGFTLTITDDVRVRPPLTEQEGDVLNRLLGPNDRRHDHAR